MGKKLGYRVRMCRLNLGITQRELAKACDLSAAYISQIESGKKQNIGRNNLEKIAEALGETVEFLLYGTKKDPPVKRPVLSKDENAMLEIYRKLADEGQESVRKYLAWLLYEQEKITK